MSLEHFRIITFLVYLGSWLAVAVGAIAGAIPRRRQVEEGAAMPPTAALGTMLQVVAALPITLTLSDGPLRPGVVELLGALAVAPFGAAMYWWAVRSTPRGDGARRLATGGAYEALRHPMYLAFFALVVATGLLASGGWKLAVAAALYLAGTELRIAAEETELAQRFGDEYSAYRRATRWRYLWGIR
jgi:protein-S-isoprenylcysteine O-methyltransferase Ste14